MDTRFIFEQVQRMRPSSFSEEEQHCYKAEKMMLRQFLLMKQQEQLPDYLSVRDMKTWLLTGRSFLEEFQEIIERTGIDHLFMAELAWTTARLFCLSQMEEELLEELDKERCLSQLFSRKVTLEGLQMFVSIVHPKAEKVAQTFLSALHRKMLQIFWDIQTASGPVSAEDAKPAELMELEQSAAALIPEVVDTALKFLLEDPERENKSKAASAEIGKLLTNSAFPCLSRSGSVSETLLLGVCTKEAQSMVEAIYNRFDKCSRSFKLMDYDESYYDSREGVISAIQDMDHEVQTDAPSQAHFQLEEGLVKEREASPWAALDQEIDFMPKDVAEDTYRKEATLVQDSVVQNMDNNEQVDASSQAHLHMKEELLEKRETSLDLSPLEELKEGLMDKREASPRVALEEEVATFPNDVTEDTYVKEEILFQDSATKDMDYEVQFGASTEPHIKLEEVLIAERKISLYFTSLEELENKLVEQRVASTRVALDEEVDTLPHNVKNMNHVEQLDASSQAPLQLEEGLLEERETSPRVSLDEEVDSVSNDVTEETLVQDSAIQDMDHEVQTDASSQAHFQLEEGLVEKREASPWVALDKEVDFMPKEVTEDTYRKEATLVQDSVVQNMDNDKQVAASSQAHLHMKEELLEKRETSLDLSPLEELKEGLVDKREASPRVALEDKVVTLPDNVVKNMNHVEQQDAFSQAPFPLEEGLVEEREASPRVTLDGEVDTSNDVTEETLVQDSAIQDMDHELHFGASSQAHLQLEEGLLEEREACVEITSLEELDMGIMEVSKMSAQVSLDEEVDTLPKDLIEDTCRKRETLVQVSVHYMDHQVQFHASSQAHIKLEEGPLKRRKALPRVSLEEMATRVSLANRDTSSVRLETNVAVYLVDELEILQQEEVEVYETLDFLVQDCADKKKKKKKGSCAFFCGLRKMMKCGFCVPIKQ
ncbi:uncharacterized protein LOC117949603 [Etheostoma cragini]|uniref:uncharacterized protein LOC117949603 n=1 Tax=Etheostoma cragini TaxID=417921 RepID=UPI00155EDA41|nr:uncharacterized protein LOC117949603 [Etheostoma cragini]